MHYNKYSKGLIDLKMGNSVSKKHAKTVKSINILSKMKSVMCCTLYLEVGIMNVQ